MQRKWLWLVLCLILGCGVVRVVTAAAVPSPSWTQIAWVTQTVRVSPGQTAELVARREGHQTRRPFDDGFAELRDGYLYPSEREEEERP